MNIHNTIKWLNTEEGKNSDYYINVPSVYKKPLDLKYNPKTKEAWRYINPSNGKITVKQPMTLDQKFTINLQ